MGSHSNLLMLAIIERLSKIWFGIDMLSRKEVVLEYKISYVIFTKLVPCGQKKVYDRVCSLNQLIDFLSYILFLSIYTDNSFFANMFFKINRKKVKVI